MASGIFTGLDDRDAHSRAHGGPEGLGGPNAGAAVAQQHAVKAERRRRAQQGAHIAGVLHPLQRQIPPARSAPLPAYAPACGTRRTRPDGCPRRPVCRPHGPPPDSAPQAEFASSGAFFSRRFGVEQGFQLRATGQLRAELAALGQKAALAAAERRTLDARRQAYLIFAFSRLVIFFIVMPASARTYKKDARVINTRGRLVKRS